MARERLKHPELKIQTLARQFKDLAEGAEGDDSEAKHRRLAGKFRKREAELMVWAKEQPDD